MAEPPAMPVPHLPGYPEDEFSDFTHRDYRPFHPPNPTPKGIPYPVGMSPSKAASLLNKVAAKSRMMARGKAGTKTSGKGTVISHGRK